ncbi:hypothetical protein, partial [Bradyrhizobium sp.]|uniref:hypothetical protein n=1 Tax=Bradyrhizobium sp. TaxID=376 RepID=UPI00391B518B
SGFSHGARKPRRSGLPCSECRNATAMLGARLNVISDCPGRRSPASGETTKGIQLDPLGTPQRLPDARARE